MTGFIVPVLDSSLINNDKHYRSKGRDQYECPENERVDWILHRRSPPALEIYVCYISDSLPSIKYRGRVVNNLSMLVVTVCEP